MNIANNESSVAPSASLTYDVRYENAAGTEEFLTKMAARFERKGLTGFAWSWGPAFERVTTHKNGKETRVLCRPLTILTHRPHYAGWNFVATVQHLPANLDQEGQNILRTVPGCMVHDDCKAMGREMGLLCTGVTELPAMYATRGPLCDHCGVNRKRIDTYILHHADGRYAQVGSTCIADFLGSKEAEHVAWRAEQYAAAAEFLKDAETKVSAAVATSVLSSDPRSSWGMLLNTFLGYVVWNMRKYGWMSGKMAEGNPAAKTTGSRAYELAWHVEAFRTAENNVSDFDADSDNRFRGLSLRSEEWADAMSYETTEADVALAVAAAKWAESLTDAEVNQSDRYMSNLRAIGRTRLVNSRMIGYAASMICAYCKASGAELPGPAKPAKKPMRALGTTYVGNVGERLAFGPFRKLPKTTLQTSNDAVTLVDVRHVSHDDEGTFSVLTFVTSTNDTLVWMTGGEFDKGNVGRSYALVGTVKRHALYKGENQTHLSRCAMSDPAEVAKAPEKKPRASRKLSGNVVIETTVEVVG